MVVAAMRELGFSKLWPKLAQPSFTTFRFTRRDRDWAVGEPVTVVFKPRSRNDRSVLGQAVITAKVQRRIWRKLWLPPGTKLPDIDLLDFEPISEQEAQADGFSTRTDMIRWVSAIYGPRITEEPMNKLTLAWQQIWLFVPEQKPGIAAHWATVMMQGPLRHHIKSQKAHYILHQDLLDAIQSEAVKGGIQ